MVYKVTKKNVLESMNLGERLDGRKPFEHRKIEVSFGVSNKAEGSVRVKVGKTEVVCGIKMGTQAPYTDHENEGTMSVSMELLPLASANFEYGQPSIQAVEIGRVVDRGIRESRFIDFKKLCIKEGTMVWSIFVDLAVINDDGNLIDVAALAAVLALMTARFPEYDEEKNIISYGEFTDKTIPLKLENMPLTSTFYKIGEKLFLDPTREEEDSADGRVTFEVSKPEKEEMINAMQKGGAAVFSIDETMIMAEESTKVFKKLKGIIDEAIEGFEKSNKKSKKAKE
ncbi:MAG: RNA-binding protein [archaeon]|nr:RNA-binding protein [archaeon]